MTSRTKRILKLAKDSASRSASVCDSESSTSVSHDELRAPVRTVGVKTAEPAKPAPILDALPNLDTLRHSSPDLEDISSAPVRFANEETSKPVPITDALPDTSSNLDNFPRSSPDLEEFLTGFVSSVNEETPKPVPTTSALPGPSTNLQYLSSSEESDPYADSGEDYVPSDLDSNHSSAEESNHQESDSNDNDGVNTSTIHNNPMTDNWGPCGDVPNNFTFSGQSGLKRDNLDLSDPYSIYRQFITDEVLGVMVTETNRYAAEYIRTHNLRPRSFVRKWKNTDRQEMKKLLATLMIMGITHLPKMRMYWANNEMFGNKLIQTLFKRDRFDCLLKFLHVANNADPAAGVDRLHKVKNILDLICQQFQNTLSPGECVVIDETMVPWRGRLVFRQYLPAKSHKYGVKIYKVCTPDGYTYNLQIYAGKNAPGVPVNGHTYDVCMSLLSGLLNEGRTLFVDNFYSSVQLCKDLLSLETYLCGTLRSNRRGNPVGVSSKKLKKGDVYGEQNSDGIRVMKWVDKRPVLMISSVPSHKPELKATGVKRRGEDVTKPLAVIAYNKAKKGVDVSDQMSSYYTSLRKTIKWYKKVFLEVVLGTCVVNSWVLYNNFGNNRKKLDMLHVRQQIIEGLLKTEEDEDTAEAEATENEGNENEDRSPKRAKSRGGAKHKMERFDGPARVSRKRCTPCYQKIKEREGYKEAMKKAKRVCTYCVECPEQPTMCLPCFNEKHA